MGQFLQKAPAGLLQLFRLRSGGVGPNEFSDTCMAVTDVTDFYGADRVACGTEAVSAGAFPRTAGATISANPRRILAVSGQVTFGAAVSGTYVTLNLHMLGYPGAVSASPQVIGFSHFVPVAGMAGATFAVVANLSSPLVLPAGHVIRVMVASDVAGADHSARVTYSFQRLDSD